MSDGYSVRGKVWIARGEMTFLGYGRVILLERIREHGSISAAARSMGLAYRHAWRLVDAMNREAPCPLVLTAKGGSRGGGARLTTAGEEAIGLFWGLYEATKAFHEQQTQKVTQTLAGWQEKETG